VNRDAIPRICPANSTTEVLGSAESFTGPWIDVQHLVTVTTAVKADVAGTLYMEFSNDSTQVNADSTLTYDVAANINEVHTLKRTRRYYRTRYLNGSSAQSSFEITTMYETSGFLTAPKNLSLNQDADALATRGTNFEQEIAEGSRGGYKIIQKFGRNSDIDTGTVPEDVWNGGGVYTGFPVSTVETLDVFSSSANDAAAGSGARTVRLFGLDANGDEQTEDVTLDGTNPVTTSNTWFRMNRAICLTSGSSNQAFNAGEITARHTTTTANVFMVMPASTNQTTIAAYTIPAGKTGYFKRLQVDVSRANTANINGAIWVRESGSTPRLIRQYSGSNAVEHNDDPYGGLKLPALTDIAVKVTSTSANNTDVSARFDIILVDD